MLAAREPLRLAARSWRLPRATDTPRTVLTVPGFGAGDASMSPLRAYLNRIGHRSSGWGQGRNGGDVDGHLPALVERVEAAAERAGESVDIIGWSLGGVLAREVARDVPHAVGRVFTYGTPVVGGPRFTRAAAAYGDARIRQIEVRIAEREQTPIRTPVTAIYSRRDGIVAWEACIDRNGHDVEHHEVRSSHVGMGVDPDVWHIIADRLGR